MADRTIVRIEDLHKTYGETEVIKGISLEDFGFLMYRHIKAFWIAYQKT